MAAVLPAPPKLSLTPDEQGVWTAFIDFLTALTTSMGEVNADQYIGLLQTASYLTWQESTGAGGSTGVSSFNARTGAVVLTASDVTGVGGALTASPALTGTPTAPTPAAADNSTSIATTAFVTTAIAAGKGPYLLLTGGTVTGYVTMNASPAITTAALTLNQAPGGNTDWPVLLCNGSVKLSPGQILRTDNLTITGGGAVFTGQVSWQPGTGSYDWGDQCISYQRVFTGPPGGVTMMRFVNAGGPPRAEFDWPIQMVGGATEPAGPLAGLFWYNTGSNLMEYYNGTSWVEMTGGGGGGGTVTSIVAGAGLTGGTISTSGTIALSTPVSVANGGLGGNVAPTAGQILQTFTGTQYRPVTISGDGTLSGGGVFNVVGIRSVTIPTLNSGYLHYNGSAFVWDTPVAVTSVVAGAGLTGGTISTTGTIALSTPVAVANGGTGTTLTPTTGQLLSAQSASAYGPVTISGDATISNAGVITVTRSGGSLLTNLFAPLTNPASGQNNYAPLASPTFTGTVTMPDGSTIVTSGSNGTAGQVYGYQNLTGLSIGNARSASTPVGGWLLTLGQSNTPCVLFQSPGYVPTASIQFNPTTSGYFDIGLTAYYNGSTWIAGGTNAGMIGWNPIGGELDFFINNGTTVSGSFTQNKICGINGGGITNNGAYYGTSSTATQIFLGGSTPNTSGASITSVGSPNLNLAAGAYWNGTWMPSATQALFMSMSPTGFGWYANTGLSVGTGFSPASVASLDMSGHFFIGQVIISNGPPNSYMGGNSGGWVIAVNGQSVWNMRAGSPDYLTWNQAAAVGGYGAYNNLSDIRAKRNVTPERRGLEVVRRLEAIRFQRLNPDGGALRPPEVGFSAQDVRSILPEAVTVIGSLLPDGSGGIDSDDPTLAITYDSIVTLLVNVVKQLDGRLAAVEMKQ